MQTAAELDVLYRPIASDMEAVRAAVGDLWHDAMKLVHGDALPKPPVGGKMMRPAMCLLSAGASGAPDTGHFVELATAMELLHLAALAHDDVIDEADTRHGTRSLRAMWDSHTAVLGGDYLVARSIAIMGHYDNCAVVTNAIDSVRMMAEGELHHFGLGQDHYSEAACISLARQKTASLFAVTCSTPAVLIENAPKQALHDFGMAVGVAFQLIDDLLDLTKDEATLGKPSCGDIVEGKKTLPIITIRAALDEAGAKRLDAMKGTDLSQDDRAWIQHMLESSGARERTENLAREYVDQACEALAPLPSSAYKDAMLGLAEFAIVRGS